MILQVLPNFTRWAPKNDREINGLIWGPYKWPKINGSLGVFHPTYRGDFTPCITESTIIRIAEPEPISKMKCHKGYEHFSLNHHPGFPLGYLFFVLDRMFLSWFFHPQVSWIYIFGHLQGCHNSIFFHL